ncbi:hypothetical protein [Neokomagataea anthophila]|uniref:hypothetical protein n=1 Tax=Neokomagataea anthophila TaxID=2826925 RepID=UPI001BA4CBBB|nr:hypothetical protein [Neokomagataea anthophila]
MHFWRSIRALGAVSHQVWQGKGRRKADSGFALLLVLWTLAFLALIGTHVLLQGRTMVVDASARQKHVALELAADSAIRQELYGLVLASPHIPAGLEAWHEREDGPYHVMIRAHLERGQVNPSVISRDLLLAVMESSGIAAPDAERASSALYGWRGHPLLGAAPPPGSFVPADMGAGCVVTHGPFHSLDDMASLPGVGWGIVRRIAPAVSLSQMQYPVSAGAEPAVQAALKRLNRSGTSGASEWLSQPPTLGGGVSVIVEALVRDEQGAEKRRANIVLMPDAEPEPWRVMRWETVPVE